MITSPCTAQSQSGGVSALPPARTWTPEIKVSFLDRLAIHGNVRAACRAVGFSPESAYRQRRTDPLFARGWASAVLKGRENSTQVLAERAIEGMEEEVWYRGELVGTRRRYDNRLLLAHLARLDRLAEELGDDEGELDEILACLAGELPPGSGPEMPYPDLDRYAQTLVISAVTEVTSTAGRGCRGATLQLKQEQAAADAWKDAQQQWDAWLARARTRIDAITSRSVAPPASGLPGNPLPADALTALVSCTGPAKEPVPFKPRTASYASTSALAHVLSAPERAWPAAPAHPGPRPDIRKGSK